jgi:hypothetical protein
MAKGAKQASKTSTKKPAMVIAIGLPKMGTGKKTEGLTNGNRKNET